MQLIALLLQATIKKAQVLAPELLLGASNKLPTGVLLPHIAYLAQ